MFGLGIWEIMAILLVAIVFINPKDLPKIARTLGKWYTQIRDVGKWVSNPAQELGDEISRPLKDVEDDINKPIQEFEEEIRNQPGNDYWKDGMPDLNSIMPSSSGSFMSQKEDPEVDEQESDKQETT